MVRMRACVLAFLIVFTCSAAFAADVSDYRIRGIYIGMSEEQLQKVIGELDREKRSEFDELNKNAHLELWVPKRSKETLVGIDSDSRKVVFVMGEELTKEGSVLFLQGDYQFRAQLGLMPMQHDDNWIFRNNKFNIAVQFTRDAGKTAPIIARIFLADPNLPVKGGWIGGVDPRPGQHDNNGGYEVQ